MDKKPPSARDIFESVAQKYGNGERKKIEISGYRKTCEVVTVKLFPEKNGQEKNKAAIFFNQDDLGYSLAFCLSEPKAGKECKIFWEMKPSGRSGEPNVSFGEISCGVTRVGRFRISHDEFNFKAREIAFKMLTDINSFIRDLTASKEAVYV